jgi:putative SOS response-associated peptidase YedK
MCGRYVRKDGSVVYAVFGVSDLRLTWTPSYNVAPMTRIPVVRRSPDGTREMVALTWGLRPEWAPVGEKLPLLINARAETVATKPSFRSAFRTRRCLVPASGYFEWQKQADGFRQPFYFERRDGAPLAFAACWEGETVATLTTRPNAECATVHDRMPVILEPAAFARYLDPEPLSAAEQANLLAPAADGTLTAWPVDPAVGNVRNNSPALLEPVRAKPAQPDLFGDSR